VFAPEVRRVRRRPSRLTPLRLYLAAFVLFVGATIAVAVGQFSAGSNVASLTSMGLSAGAVVLTIAALATRSGR
jgi:hypothetical protein